MAPRSVLFVLVVLLVVKISVVQAQTSDSTTAPATNSTALMSFCEQCRDTGICTQAYNGSPGVFCKNWQSASHELLACCCPAAAKCVQSASNYECKCQSPIVTHPDTKSDNKSQSSTWVFVFIGVVVVCLVGAAILCCAKHMNDKAQENDIVLRQGTFVYNKQRAPALGQQTLYGHPAPDDASHPVYRRSEYQQEERYDCGGGAVVAGAAAGLVGGLILGDALADSAHNDGNSYQGDGDDAFAGDV